MSQFPCTCDIGKEQMTLRFSGVECFERIESMLQKAGYSSRSTYGPKPKKYITLKGETSSGQKIKREVQLSKEEYAIEAQRYLDGILGIDVASLTGTIGSWIRTIKPHEITIMEAFLPVRCEVWSASHIPEVPSCSFTCERPSEMLLIALTILYPDFELTCMYPRVKDKEYQ